MRQSYLLSFLLTISNYCHCCQTNNMGCRSFVGLHSKNNKLQKTFLVHRWFSWFCFGGILKFTTSAIQAVFCWQLNCMVLPKQWFNYNVINSPIAKDWSQPNQIQNSRDMKPWQNTDSCSGSTQIYKETKKENKNQQQRINNGLRLICYGNEHLATYVAWLLTTPCYIYT